MRAYKKAIVDVDKEDLNLFEKLMKHNGWDYDFANGGEMYYEDDGMPKRMLGAAANPWSMGMGQLKKMAKGKRMQPRKVKRLTAPTVADFGGMIGAGLITGVTASTIGATSNIMMKEADKMARERRKKRMCASKKVLKAMGAK